MITHSASMTIITAYGFTLVILLSTTQANILHLPLRNWQSLSGDYLLLSLACLRHSMLVVIIRDHSQSKRQATICICSLLIISTMRTNISGCSTTIHRYATLQPRSVQRVLIGLVHTARQQFLISLLTVRMRRSSMKVRSHQMQVTLLRWLL